MNVNFINSFNKIIKNDINHVSQIDDLEKTYFNLKENTIYIEKINFIWKNLNRNNIIKLSSDQINFIEKDFEGYFKEYLEFIIPRITKLNAKMLETFVPNSDEEKTFSSEEIDFVDSENSTESSIFNINYDDKYINILEININDLQSKVQNIIDDLLPKINNKNENLFESQSKILQIEQLVNSSIKKLNENKQDLQIQFANLSRKLDEHEKITKNSIFILETRINKIMELLNYKV